jgi:protein-S-isoprenylcysteine O-methyltransferase Ste14
MRRARAAAATAVFLALVPGTVAGLVPWWLTDWRAGPAYPLPARVGAVVLAAAGAAVLVHAFTRFVIDGHGTPAPIAPTEQLVVSGLYRYVRNPMYLAVLAVITGQALLLGRPVLLGYAAAVAATVAAFVHWYEEPALTRRYGAVYQRYRQTVPAWLPRLRRRPGHRAHLRGAGCRRRRKQHTAE